MNYLTDMDGYNKSQTLTYCTRQHCNISDTYLRCFTSLDTIMKLCSYSLFCCSTVGDRPILVK